MPVMLNVANLIPGRLKKVQAILRPLAKKGKPVPCNFVPNPRAKSICGHGGGPGQDHTNIWFPTSVNGIQGQYHEIWYPLGGEHEWWMERAYFGIRRVVRTLAKAEEILCVHSDPMCDVDDPVGSYKRGPHLHVSVAQSPIAKAHFPLNLGHLEDVLSSCDNLSQAISLAIKVVCDEVISRL